ncbi:MAG: GvpL/GvpF family gas vesicle protein [Candidatus Omnitrophica bacterium]|nr:GvpL/GvpF family gas vesicle protein [Candidatus Omnitrophota bacterium]
MDRIGKYIFGVINSNTNFRFFIPNFLSEEDSIYEISSIPYQDISAIVCDLEIVEYTHMRKDALAKLLVGHQKVIERIMNLKCSILPVKLGTFALDEAEVKDVLSKGYSLIKKITREINDKVEIDVVCVWSDFTAAIKEAGEQKEIREFKEKLLKQPKSITIDEQMMAGGLLKKEIDQMREKKALKIQDALKTLCADYKQHELMDDKMVANSAFLINEPRQKEFYAKIEDLNTEFEEKLNFRCVGPLPPYSFFTLEIKRMRFNDIDWARKRLGILEDCITKDDIKKAYQRQAFCFHPDKNPDKPGMEREFDEIKKSYNILLDYAQGCAQSGKESLYFNEDEFKRNAVLVKVKE